MASPIPSLLSNAAKIAAGVAVAAGAVAILNGITGGNAFNPVLTNNYTSNSLTRFPNDLPQIDGEMFCILFQFYQYNRPSILVPPTLNPYGAIALPIPTDLIDQSAMSYSEETSSAAISAGMEAFNAGPNPNVASVLMGLAESGSAITAQAGVNAINSFATNIPGTDSRSGARLLQFAGVAQNPFLSVLFNAPTFKRHVFSWTFIPETPQDTENLNFIINKFRYHSMPDINTSSGGLLLNYPDMCIPTLIPQGYMYDFKQCVVESMSINYAPGDTPSFNTKNAPNAIKFTVKFLEIEYWVKSDLLNASANFGSSAATNALFGQAPYGSDK